MSQRAWRRLFLQLNLGFLCFLLLLGAFLSRLLFEERVCLCVRWLYLCCPGAGAPVLCSAFCGGNFLSMRIFGCRRHCCRWRCMMG